MELSLPHTLHLFNIFHENDGKENCAQVLEEEVYKMFGTKSLYDEHDCNVVSMNSLNIHDANDMQSHKLGEAMYDEDDIFCPPSFDENTNEREETSQYPPIISYDESGNEEELSIQPISSIRSSKKRDKPAHDVKKKKKKQRSKGKKVSLPNDVAPTTH